MLAVASLLVQALNTIRLNQPSCAPHTPSTAARVFSLCGYKADIVCYPFLPPLKTVSLWDGCRYLAQRLTPPNMCWMINSLVKFVYVSWAIFWILLVCLSGQDLAVYPWLAPSQLSHFSSPPYVLGLQSHQKIKFYCSIMLKFNSVT